MYKILQMTLFADIWMWSLVVGEPLVNKSQVLTLRKYSGQPSVKGNFFLQPYRARALRGPAPACVPELPK